MGTRLNSANSRSSLRLCDEEIMGSGLWFLHFFAIY